MAQLVVGNEPLKCCYAGEERLGQPVGIQVPRDKENKNDELCNDYVVKAFGNYIKKNAAIIFLSDVTGVSYNNCLLADQFAAAGYHTVIPNYQGKTGVLTSHGKIEDIKSRQHTSAQKKSIIKEHILSLRHAGYLKIGGVGYTSGAPYAIQLLDPSFLAESKKADDGDARIDAAFVVDVGTVSGPVINKLLGPLSIAIGDEDMSVGPAVVERLFKAVKERGFPYQVNVYSHVQDGFAVRRAATSASEVFAKKQAFVQAVTWMEEFLKVEE